MSDDGRPEDARKAARRDQIEDMLEQMQALVGSTEAREAFFSRPIETWSTAQLVGLISTANIYQFLRTSGGLPESTFQREEVQTILLKAVEAENELNFRVPTDAEIAGQAADEIEKIEALTAAEDNGS